MQEGALPPSRLAATPPEVYWQDEAVAGVPVLLTDS